ncbi:hypothetical protein [Caballeronia glebae]|uniref:hypothetical protein n=1 Tax=Caballeronia glebae TaxID=1777143 RepID=UPI0038BAC44C
MSVRDIEKSILAVLPQDECVHALAGVLIFGAVHFVSWQAGIAAVVAAGIVKEVVDHFTDGDVSVWDVVATVTGGLLGVLCFA